MAGISILRRLSSIGKNEGLKSVFFRALATGGGGSYKAVVCTEIGAPLQIQSQPSKPTSENMVKISVHNAGINFADTLIVKGKYQEKAQTPFVGGGEFSGVVKEIGDKVNGFSVGDRVLGMNPLTGAGAFAEECLVLPQGLFKIPESIDFKTAAALPVSYGTAWLSLQRIAQVQSSDTVLVTAGAGAFGMAALDMAINAFKAKTVIAACGGEEKASFLKSRGVEHVIDYKNEDLIDRVQKITGKHGVNVIVDAVGGDIFKKCLRIVSFEGRMVLVGFASGEIPRIPANILLVKSCSARGVYWGDYMKRDLSTFRESVESSIKLCSEGKITPHVSN